jgi:hypothetical protein
VQRHVFGPVARHHRKAHTLKQIAQLGWIRRGIFNKLKAVRAHRVGKAKRADVVPRNRLFRLRAHRAYLS